MNNHRSDIHVDVDKNANVVLKLLKKSKNFRFRRSIIFVFLNNDQINRVMKINKIKNELIKHIFEKLKKIVYIAQSYS